jgi:transposase
MLTTIRPQEYDLCVAIDTSKKSYSVTSMSHERSYQSCKMPADPKNLMHYTRKRFPAKRPLFVYEAGPGGYSLHDELTKNGFSCMIVHPASLAKAANERVKTNRLDSKKLAEQSLSGQLQSIRIPDMDYRQLRHLATTRQQYAQDIRRAKQRIKALILFENLPVPEEVNAFKHWSRRYRQGICRIECPNETVRFRLQILMDDLEHSQNRLLSVHRQLQQFYKDHQELHKNVQLLRTLPGFGFVISMYLLSRVCDPSRLRHVRELGAFAGLVSSEYSTGEDHNRGSITHMGDRMLRTLLIEAAWVAIRKDPELHRFYCRMKAKHSPKAAANKAIVAVARKLTMRVYRVLKDQRPYEIR